MVFAASNVVNGDKLKNLKSADKEILSFIGKVAPKQSFKQILTISIIPNINDYPRLSSKRPMSFVVVFKMNNINSILTRSTTQKIERNTEQTRCSG